MFSGRGESPHRR